MNASVSATRTTGLVAPSAVSENEIFAFQATAYPHRDPELIPKRWRWMYAESASRVGTSPMAWMYRNESGIVAYQGAIAVRVQIGSDLLTTGWFVETMVLEAVRGKTIGPAVIMQAKRDLPFNLSLGQTEQMRELQFRLGWKQVAPLQSWMWLLNPSQVVGGKLSSKFATWTAANILKTKQKTRRLISGRSRKGLTVRRVERFDERHDRLWDNVAPYYTCAVVRNASYLNWKYVEQPGQSFIRLELCDDDDEPRAIAVVMIREPDEKYGYRRAFLVEIVATPNDRPLIFATFDAVCAVCREQSADALLFQFINPSLERAVSYYGFSKRESTRYFLVCPERLTERQTQSVQSADNWLITMGDSDIDRPW